MYTVTCAGDVTMMHIAKLSQTNEQSGRLKRSFWDKQKIENFRAKVAVENGKSQLLEFSPWFFLFSPAIYK